MKRRQLSFNINPDLYKDFSKKCIDLDMKKTDILIELIKEFLKKR